MPIVPCCGARGGHLLRVTYQAYTRMRRKETPGVDTPGTAGRPAQEANCPPSFPYARGRGRSPWAKPSRTERDAARRAFFLGNPWTTSASSSSSDRQVHKCGLKVFKGFLPQGSPARWLSPHTLDFLNQEIKALPPKQEVTRTLYTGADTDKAASPTSAQVQYWTIS